MRSAFHTVGFGGDRRWRPQWWRKDKLSKVFLSAGDSRADDAELRVLI